MRMLLRIGAVLALIPLLSFGERPNRQAKGFLVDVATVRDNCEETYSIVAKLIGHHRVKLNEEPDRGIVETVARLREVLKFRTEKLVYVKAVADFDFGEFIELVDALRPEIHVISLLLPRVEAIAHGDFCLVPSCNRCEKFSLGKHP